MLRRLLEKLRQRTTMRREEGELLGDGVLVEHMRLVGGDGMRVASHDGVGLSRGKMSR
jgi:hypothetical protein